MQTATNPQTGEKLVLQNGQWVPMGGAAPRPQSFTVGTPRAPDPFKVRDQQLQEEAAARAREDQQFQRQKFEREMSQKDSEKTTDGQRSAAGYYSRALRAHRGYGEGIEPRGAITQTIVDKLPHGVVNEMSSPERRAAQNWADEFIRAKLRRESGASIPTEEMQREYEVYFPLPGDTEADLKRKAGLREQAIEALRNEAGAAGQTITVNPVEGQQGDIGFNTPDQPKNPLNQEQQQAYDLFFRLNPNATPEQLQAFGQSLGINVENAQAIIEARNKGAGVQPASEAVSGLTPEQQAEVAQRVQRGGGLGAALVGATDAMTLGFGDEISAGGDAFMGALSGEGSLGDLYNQNIGVERAMKEQFGSEHPFLYTGGQIAGGAAIPAGVGGGVGRLAAVGAAQGGAYGFGSGEGGIGDRLPTAGAGAALGGAVGAGLGIAAPYAENALLRFSNRPSRAARAQEAADARPVIDAAERQGLSLRQPDVRPGLRGDMAAIEKSPTAGPEVGNVLRSDREALANRVIEVGPAGEARDPYSLGNQVQDAVNRHGSRTKDEATVGYQRAKLLAKDHKADPAPVFSAIDNRIADLAANGETANAAEIKVLEGIKSDLSKSGLTIESLQTQRRAMRQRLKDNGIDFGSADASYMEIMDEAGRQLENSLSSNPRAQSALRSANEKWAERSSFRKEVARQFIGTKGAPVSPETAAARFLSMAKEKGDYNRFSRMFNEMDAVEKSDFGATIAEGLGKTKSGEFQYGKFVSDLEGMNPRALRDLFGKDGAAALEDLKLIARRKSETAAGLNHSNTGSVIARSNGFKDIILAAFGGSVAGIPGAIAGALTRGTLERFSSKRAARMLLNPDFTKWLKNTPPTTKPAVINEHFARLAKVATRDAVFTADVKALQQLLAESFSRAPVRAAASDKEDDSGPKPPGQ